MLWYSLHFNLECVIYIIMIMWLEFDIEYENHKSELISS